MTHTETIEALDKVTAFIADELEVREYSYLPDEDEYIQDVRTVLKLAKKSKKEFLKGSK
jgi:hypothetical protein